MYNEIQKAIYSKLSAVSGLSGCYFSKAENATYPYCVFYLTEKSNNIDFGSNQQHQMECQINVYDKSINSKPASDIITGITDSFDYKKLSGMSGYSSTFFARQTTQLERDNLNKNWQGTIVYKFKVH